MHMVYLHTIDIQVQQTSKYFFLESNHEEGGRCPPYYFLIYIWQYYDECISSCLCTRPKSAKTAYAAGIINKTNKVDANIPNTIDITSGWITCACKLVSVSKGSKPAAVVIEVKNTARNLSRLAFTTDS